MGLVAMIDGEIGVLNRFGFPWMRRDSHEYDNQIDEYISYYIPLRGHIKSLFFMEQDRLEEIEIDSARLPSVKEVIFCRCSFQKLPRLLHLFPHLQRLSLLKCGIRRIDESIGDFKMLRDLEIIENHPVPEFDISREILGCTKLQRVKLQGYLTEIPAVIWALKGLKHLDLGLNDIENLPPEIGKLTYLHTFQMPQNKLTTVPRELGNLRYLHTLDLSANKISSIPTGLNGLKNLTSLKLHTNRIREIPEFVKGLKKLKTLELGANRISSYHQELADLKELQVFSLNKNIIESFAADTQFPPNLRSFSISENKLTTDGYVFAALKSLEVLYLTSNRITTLSHEFGGLTTLKKLFISGNPLKPLPLVVCQLPSLEFLSFSDLASKQIPAEIMQLKKLKTLKISYITFTEPPQWLLNMPWLREVAFHGEDPYGSIWPWHYLLTYIWTDDERNYAISQKNIVKMYEESQTWSPATILDMLSNNRSPRWWWLKHPELLKFTSFLLEKAGQLQTDAAKRFCEALQEIYEKIPIGPDSDDTSPTVLL
jgi:Leucine-rich repeat (LRR) protein